jgi:hypothetical protein
VTASALEAIVLDFLVAVGQFLCLVGFTLGLLLAIAKWRRPHPNASRENIAADGIDNAARSSVKLAVIPQTPHATMRVVPIETSRLMKGQKSIASAKAVLDQRKPSRRISNVSDPERGQRAVLLMKHARKRRRPAGPRAV